LQDVPRFFFASYIANETRSCPCILQDKYYSGKKEELEL
jgi:hypothetical protein